MSLLLKGTNPSEDLSTLEKNKLVIFFGRPILATIFINDDVLKQLANFMDEILSYIEVTSEPKYDKLASVLKETIKMVS